MEIKGFRGRTLNPIPTSVNTMIKKAEGFLDTPLVQLIDGATPIIMDYYSYDKLASVTGVGDKLTKGPYSGATKYKYIKDYVGYGYSDERNTTLEKSDKEDLKLNSDVLSFLHLPNTIVPVTGDRLTLKLENNQIWYYVTNIDQITLHNKSFIKVDYVKDDSLPMIPWTFAHMKRAGLISQELLFIQANIGTQYSPFMVEDSYNKLNDLFEKRKELNDSYMSFFYDDYTNMIRSKEDEKYIYSPLLTYLQMEYFPLKYESNDLMLSNEAISDKMTTVKWQTHDIRKFLKKKSNNLLNGITLYSYSYYRKQTDPYYKINSYMNSMDDYIVYDLTNNDDKKEITIPIPEDIKAIFEMWYNDDINSLDDLMSIIEDIYLEEINVQYMIYIPILIIIIDKIYDNLYSTSSSERFY